MRLILGSTAAAAMIAVPATAANTFVNFYLTGDGGTTVTHYANMSGTLTDMYVSFDFEDSTLGDSWASDLLVGVTDSNGNSYEWGGNDGDMTFGYAYADGFPSSWDTSANGAYAHNFTALDGLGLNGTGMWKFEFMNAYSKSGDNTIWDGQLELATTGPAVPGIAAMVPFAGIAAIRRRRRR